MKTNVSSGGQMDRLVNYIFREYVTKNIKNINGTNITEITEDYSAGKLENEIKKITQILVKGIFGATVILSYVFLFVISTACEQKHEHVTEGGLATHLDTNKELQLKFWSDFFQNIDANQAPRLTGPLVVMEGNTFEVALVGELNGVTHIQWLVDGRLINNNNRRLLKMTAELSSILKIQARIFSAEKEIVLTHFVQVVEYMDGFECIEEIALDGPFLMWEDDVGTYRVKLPHCMKDRRYNFLWSINQRALNHSTQSSDLIQYRFEQGSPLLNQISVKLIFNDRLIAQLTREVVVLPKRSSLPGPEQEPNHSEKEKHECPQVGEEKVVSRKTIVETEPCGFHGEKVVSWELVQLQQCALDGNGIRRWSERTQKNHVGSSECLKQKCTIAKDGQTILIDDGQTVTGLIFGTEKEVLTCEWNEEGYYRIYQVRKDVACHNGRLQDVKQYRGELMEEKSCPKYYWDATEVWSECSGDCGGTQNRIFRCMDQYGQVSVDEQRCLKNSDKPIEKRVCSLKLDQVVRLEERVHQETVGSEKCDSKEIGQVIVTKKSIIQQEYVCSNHQVVMAREHTVKTELHKERQCTNYVASRCSHDSLSVTEARGRFQWMKKCENQIPILKEFLDEYHRSGIKDGQKRSFDSKRPLYASFMYVDRGKTKVWKAPTQDDEPCWVPNQAYIAAICVSSCATPDQYTLVGDALKGSVRWMTFKDALENKETLVQTLSNNTLNRKNTYQATRVDQWVTEFMDTEHDIAVIRTRSGGLLKLTLNHPMVLADGTLKWVSDLKVGDSLIDAHFNQDEIVSIEVQKYFGKVYNIFTLSSSIPQNIVVINNYLTGSAMFQNEAADLINRRIFRNELLKKVQQNSLLHRDTRDKRRGISRP
ncbi:MAG: hypothetical protein NZ480_01685 [Bdellovibrionaceae bacterium]|nr:hypothetical protein [Pseudobdellovibrionaceae bacterium]